MTVEVKKKTWRCANMKKKTSLILSSPTFLVMWFSCPVIMNTVSKRTEIAKVCLRSKGNQMSNISLTSWVLWVKKYVWMTSFKNSYLEDICSTKVKREKKRPWNVMKSLSPAVGQVDLFQWQEELQIMNSSG